MDYSSFDFLSIKVADGIATVTIDRPDALNAPDIPGHAEFARSLRWFAKDDDVRAVVLTGAGRAFSVGGSFEMEEELRSDVGNLPEQYREARELIYAHLELDKPVVTALNGYALGSGSAYGLLADFIIVERHVRFGDGHIAAGLAAGDGGVLIWPLAVGMVQAKKYLLTGDFITAEEAERIGLVTEVVETGESLERAQALARRLADGPQRAIRYTKRALNQFYRQATLTSFDLSLSLEMETFYFDDAMVEALESMKRKGPSAIDRTWQWR